MNSHTLQNGKCSNFFEFDDHLKILVFCRKILTFTPEKSRFAAALVRGKRDKLRETDKADNKNASSSLYQPM